MRVPAPCRYEPRTAGRAIPVSGSRAGSLERLHASEGRFWNRRKGITRKLQDAGPHSQPGWQHWQWSSIMPWASWQRSEQNFLPASTVQ